MWMWHIPANSFLKAETICRTGIPVNFYHLCPMASTSTAWSDVMWRTVSFLCCHCDLFLGSSFQCPAYLRGINTKFSRKLTVDILSFRSAPFGALVFLHALIVWSICLLCRQLKSESVFLRIFSFLWTTSCDVADVRSIFSLAVSKLCPWGVFVVLWSLLYKAWNCMVSTPSLFTCDTSF